MVKKICSEVWRQNKYGQFLLYQKSSESPHMFWDIASLSTCVAGPWHYWSNYTIGIDVFTANKYCLAQHWKYLWENTWATSLLHWYCLISRVLHLKVRGGKIRWEFSWHALCITKYFTENGLDVSSVVTNILLHVEWECKKIRTLSTFTYSDPSWLQRAEESSCRSGRGFPALLGTHRSEPVWFLDHQPWSFWTYPGLTGGTGSTEPAVWRPQFDETFWLGEISGWRRRLYVKTQCQASWWSCPWLAGYPDAKCPGFHSVPGGLSL